MARIRALRDNITGEPFFENTETRVQYRRIMGGLAWPEGVRSGCALVLGELRTKDNVLETRRQVFVLDEKSNDEPAGIVKDLAALQDNWLVWQWATPIVDPRVYLLDDYNDERRRIHRAPIRYTSPDRWTGKGEGLMSFYRSLVQRRTGLDSEKTLHLGPGRICADEIGKLQPEDASRKPTDFPAAAALFFALAEIDGNPVAEWGQSNFSGGFGPADFEGGY